ncbi:MAG: hypothetical protein ABRQ37_00495 [Candidatus Eremiobacterota bacterium]
MEATLNQILSEIKKVNERLDNLEEIINEKIAEIKILNRNLDRQMARLDIISTSVKEHEIRIEGLEELKY